MPLELNVGPNNMLPSKIGAEELTAQKAEWFEGALSVQFQGGASTAVLLDFASDEYLLFSTASGASKGYVTSGYVSTGYVAEFLFLNAAQYVDHEYASPEYVNE